MDDADDWDAFINPSGSEDEVANITPHAGGGDPAASGADVTGGKPARAAPLQHDYITPPAFQWRRHEKGG